MSTTIPQVSDSQFVEPSAGVAPVRSALHQTLHDAWRMGRTKVGVGICVAILCVAIFGPYVAPYSPTEFVAHPWAPPSSVAWLGTDYIGHDVLTRVLYGGRTVITLALAATFIGLTFGVTLGLIAGTSRRYVDEGIMRLLDVILAFPSIVLALLFVSVVGPKLWLLVLVVGVSHAPGVARVTRGAALEVANRDFVRASEAIGVPRRRILFSEVLPNITSPLMVEFGLRLTYSIGTIASLSFLGFGMQPPAADWGLMINENRIGVLVQPWAIFTPVILIGILTIGTNLVTDGLGRAMVGIDRDTGVS